MPLLLKLLQVLVEIELMLVLELVQARKKIIELDVCADQFDDGVHYFFRPVVVEEVGTMLVHASSVELDF